MAGRTNVQRLAVGLTILAGYEGTTASAQSDVVYAGIDPSLDGAISIGEEIRLRELGWTYSEEYECWQFTF